MTEQMNDPMACPVRPRNPIIERLEGVIADLRSGALRGPGCAVSVAVLHRLIAALYRGEQSEFGAAVCGLTAIPGLDATIQPGEARVS